MMYGQGMFESGESAGIAKFSLSAFEDDMFIESSGVCSSMGAEVNVGDAVGAGVGVGDAVGAGVGVGDAVGAGVGVGDAVGAGVGVGDAIGVEVGISLVPASVGIAARKIAKHRVRLIVNSLFI
jgi:hypothetical protein